MADPVDHGYASEKRFEIVVIWGFCSDLANLLLKKSPQHKKKECNSVRAAAHSNLNAVASHF